MGLAILPRLLPRTGPRSLSGVVPTIQDVSTPVTPLGRPGPCFRCRWTAPYLSCARPVHAYRTVVIGSGIPVIVWTISPNHFVEPSKHPRSTRMPSLEYRLSSSEHPLPANIEISQRDGPRSRLPAPPAPTRVSCAYYARVQPVSYRWGTRSELTALLLVSHSRTGMLPVVTRSGLTSEMGTCIVV